MDSERLFIVENVLNIKIKKPFSYESAFMKISTYLLFYKI